MFNTEDLLNIPFRNFGRDKNGCDCMGLAILVHKKLKKRIPDFKIDCTASKNINEKFEDQLGNDRWKKIEEPEAPCLVLYGFDANYKSMVTHLGTYIGDGKIIHTIENRSSHVIKIDHPFYKNKIIGFYKYE